MPCLVLDTRMRSIPSGVLGPVLRPPCIRHRPLVFMPAPYTASVSGTVVIAGGLPSQDVHDETGRARACLGFRPSDGADWFRVALTGAAIALLAISLWPTFLHAQTQAPAAGPRGQGLIAGRVVDGSTGQPVGGATVTLDHQPPASVVPPSSPAAEALRMPTVNQTTGQDGRFQFGALPVGRLGSVRVATAIETGTSDSSLPMTPMEGPGSISRLASSWRISRFGCGSPPASAGS